MTQPGKTPREELAAAVENYLVSHAAQNGDNVIVAGWVLCYETTSFDDAGETQWAINYTCGDPGTLAGTVGLVQIAQAKMARDIVAVRVQPDTD